MIRIGTSLICSNDIISQQQSESSNPTDKGLQVASILTHASENFEWETQHNVQLNLWDYKQTCIHLCTKKHQLTYLNIPESALLPSLEFLAAAQIHTDTEISVGLKSHTIPSFFFSSSYSFQPRVHPIKTVQDWPVHINSSSRYRCTFH